MGWWLRGLRLEVGGSYSILSRAIFQGLDFCASGILWATLYGLRDRDKNIKMAHHGVAW